MQINLTDDNFLIECAKNYRNSQCSGTEEFLSDLKRIKYIKKILTRYAKTKIIDERLVLNHIIILYNVFGPEFLARILFLKMLPQMEFVKPFLIYLKILPDKIKLIEGKDYDTIDIPLNQELINKLRSFDKSIK
jgi:hypothetical protein